MSIYFVLIVFVYVLREMGINREMEYMSSICSSSSIYQVDVSFECSFYNVFNWKMEGEVPF